MHIRRKLFYVVMALALTACLVEVEPPTATPRPTTVSSPSTSTWYLLFFTSPKYPDKENDHTGKSLDEKLAIVINSAKTSVDMAIYQLDLSMVTQALIDAKTRGARVRVVTDVDVYEDPKENPSFKQLEKAGIKVVSGNSSGIMHDKFVVVDNSVVWTGSWNFTTNDTYRYNNNGIVIQSSRLASNYTVVFEKMFNSQLFGAKRKGGGTTPKFTINNINVESYFSPDDAVSAAIVNRLKQAKTSIHFMAYSFTDDEIGKVLIERWLAGVKVRGVFENTGSQTQFSEFKGLKAAGADVLTDGNPYLMHHKVFIIDSRTVIFGSYNFSANAQTDNDENLLIVDDAGLAAAFEEEFARVYATAKNPPK
jgi:phosphatidylserine/phosphatidylglycerophosphate/cardiolipin synthase-like enzyme